MTFPSFSSIALLLTAFGTLASADNCNPQAVNNFVLFDPPTLDYNATTPAATFTVQLGSAPVNGTVQISLNVDGFKFDQNQVTFTQANWNQPQQVIIVANQAAAAGASTVVLDFTINAPCLESMHQCSGNYFINHEAPVGGATMHCAVTGDPHMSTFDGSTISYQNSGGFYYVKSTFLEVQGYQYPCSEGNSIACVGAISVRYGDSVLMISGMQMPGTINTQAEGASLSLISPHMNGLTYTPEDVTTATGFTITTDDGSVIIIGWSSMPYMSVDITLPALYTGIVTGQCTESGSGDTFNNPWPIESANYNMQNKYVPGPYPTSQFWGPKGAPALVPGMTFAQGTFTNTCIIVEQAPPAPVVVPVAAPNTGGLQPYNPNEHVVIPPTIPSAAVAPIAPAAPAAPAANATSAAPAAPAAPVAPAAPAAPGAPAVSAAPVAPAVPAASIAIASAAPIGAPSSVAVGADILNATSSAPVAAVPVAAPTVASVAPVASVDPAAPVVSVAPVAPVAPVVAAVTTPVYSPNDIAQATAQCTEVINGDAGCSDLTDNRIQFMIDSCAKDVLATGSHDFTEGHRRSACVHCNQLASSIVNAPVQVANATVAAAAVQVSNGFGANACPSNCSAQGTCGSAGCICNAGFSGMDCSVVLSTLVVPSPVQGAASAPVPMSANPVIQALIQSQPQYAIAPVVAAAPVSASVQAAVAPAAASVAVPAVAPAAAVPAITSAAAVAPVQAAIVAPLPAIVAASVAASNAAPAVVVNSPVVVAANPAVAILASAAISVAWECVGLFAAFALLL
ncbi:hypothetical protein HDU98_001297 [Podochytrium sp. JEL0797]|nr:hypothetical protein HDU98_001297 [Podochytrium sp. JEL0797]